MARTKNHFIFSDKLLYMFNMMLLYAHTLIAGMIFVIYFRDIFEYINFKYLIRLSKY